MLHHQHAKATPPLIEVGDTVMKSAAESTCKLTPKFSGPYLVSSKMHEYKFKLLNPGTNTTELIHIDRLKVSAALSTVASSPSDLSFPSDASFPLQDPH